VELSVDGLAVFVAEGATLLQACDQAGRYVPRLCSYPEFGCPRRCEAGPEAGTAGEPDEAIAACGLCSVRIEDAGGEEAGGEAAVGEEAMVLACCTAARPGLKVVTNHAGLHAERLERLAEFLARHPHVCLTCPDRDGCSREECTFGISVDARCCDEFGRCEFGRLVAFVDADEELPRRAVEVPRDATVEGRIRREPGLCLGCGRCVSVCGISPAGGRALRLAPGEDGGRHPVAVPKKDTLRASGCTFCGQCVMVCPTGAVTAPGEAGARWLEGWRRRTGLSAPILPPDPWRALVPDKLTAVPPTPGVFLLADDAGRVLRIGGVADLSAGLALALAEPACAGATSFRVEPAPLFTQRESELLARFARQWGHLPPGNDLADDLFSDDFQTEDLP
jgi:ferredoxin